VEIEISEFFGYSGINEASKKEGIKRKIYSLVLAQDSVIHLPFLRQTHLDYWELKPKFTSVKESLYKSFVHPINSGRPGNEKYRIVASWQR